MYSDDSDDQTCCASGRLAGLRTSNRLMIRFDASLTRGSHVHGLIPATMLALITSGG